MPRGRRNFIVQIEGGPARTIKAGQPFFEAANVPTVHFDNASTTGPTDIAAFYLTDGDRRPLIEMLGAAKP